MARLRKLSNDDRTILATVLKTHGADWTYYLGNKDNHNSIAAAYWVRGC